MEWSPSAAAAFKQGLQRGGGLRDTVPGGERAVSMGSFVCFVLFGPELVEGKMFLGFSWGLLWFFPGFAMVF